MIERIHGLIRRAFAEPLVLFMALGAGLFLLYDLVSDPADDPSSRRIVIDREAVLGYMQARAGSYGAAASARLDAMPASEVAELADNYAREEAMYREALALGLDRNDYSIRQRLVQSLRFMFRNLGETGEPSPADLQKYYEANRSRYSAPATITFTHVYFDAGQRGRTAAKSQAARTRDNLNSGNGGPIAGETWPGDRFAYGLNFADRDEQFIASQFGKTMADALFATSADPDRWQGPFSSESGEHLVRIEHLQAGKTQPFKSVRDEVARDYREWQGQQLERVAVDNLVGDYDVVISPEMRGKISGQAKARQ